MANPTIVVDIEARKRSFDAAMRSVESTLESVASKMKKVSLVASGFLAGGAYGLLRFVKGAAEEEAAINRLNLALKAQGSEAAKLTDQYSELSAQLATLSGENDNTIRDTITMGLNMGIAASKVDEMVKAATALSKVGAARGVEQAMKALADFSRGNVNALDAVFPQLQNIENESLKMAAAVRLVNDAIDQQSKAATTNQQKLSSFGTALGDLKTSIGKAFLGPLGDAAERVEKFVRTLQILIDQNQGVARSLILAAGGFTAMIAGIAPAAKAISFLVKNITLLLKVVGLLSSPFVLITAAVVGLGYAFYELGDSTDEAGNQLSVFQRVISGMHNVFAGLIDILGKFGKILVTSFKLSLKEIVADLTAFDDYIVAVVKTIGKNVYGEVSTDLNNIEIAIRNLYHRLARQAEEPFQVFKRIEFPSLSDFGAKQDKEVAALRDKLQNQLLDFAETVGGASGDIANGPANIVSKAEDAYNKVVAKIKGLQSEVESASKKADQQKKESKDLLKQGKLNTDDYLKALENAKKKVKETKDTVKQDVQGKVEISVKTGQLEDLEAAYKRIAEAAAAPKQPQGRQGPITFFDDVQKAFDTLRIGVAEATDKIRQWTSGVAEANKGNIIGSLFQQLSETANNIGRRSLGLNANENSGLDLSLLLRDLLGQLKSGAGELHPRPTSLDGAAGGPSAPASVKLQQDMNQNIQTGLEKMLQAQIFGNQQLQLITKNTGGDHVATFGN